MKDCMAQMEAQLVRARYQIERLADVSSMTEARANFDALAYIDELRALHETARAAFDELREAGEKASATMESEMNGAFRELHTALDNLMLWGFAMTVWAVGMEQAPPPSVRILIKAFGRGYRPGTHSQ